MKKILITVLACIVLAGCKSEGIVQSDNLSYLHFSGNFKGAVASIDNGKPFSLTPGQDDNGRILYKITPGKHEIIVSRDGQILVHREVLIGKGMTKEIMIR